MARTLQQELERLRPRVCQLVASLTGGDNAQAAAPQHHWGGGSGRSGHGGEDGVGIELETFTETLRRVAEKRSAARSGGNNNNATVPGLMESRLGSATSLAARAQHQYALLAQEVADEALLGAMRSTNMGSSAAGQPSAAGGSGNAASGAAAAGQDGLRASLDELCNLHDELGAIGRLPPDSGVGVDNINNFVASIQMRRADAEARLNLATAAMADAGDPVGAAERRTRRAEPFIPKTRRLIAGGGSSGTGVEKEAEDESESSAAAGAAVATLRAPTMAAGAAALPASAAARDRRNPYARVGDYLQQRRPRRQMRGDEEALLTASGQRGANNARWERQPQDYIPMRRRHPAPAPAPAGALLFPPSSHARAGGAGQPPSIPPTVFRFVRNAPSASPPAAAAQTGLPPGPVSSGAARRGRPGNRRSSNSRAEEAERAVRQRKDDGSDPFLSALPHLPSLTYQTRGGGDGAPPPAGAAASDPSSLAGASSADPDGSNARSSGHPMSSSSSFPAELAELVKLYCSRCKDTSSRLRAAVYDREALSTSTLAYLRSGGGLGGGSGGGGSAGAARGRAANGTVAARVVAAAAGVGALGWKTERGAIGWGGDGEHPRVAGAQGQGCCAKCSEEVRACVRPSSSTKEAIRFYV